MSTGAASAKQPRWQEVKRSIVLSYDERVGDDGISETDTIEATFDCRSGEDGRCTVDVLGKTSLKELVTIIQEHEDIHFPLDVAAATKASIQSAAPIPAPRPDAASPAIVVA